MFYRQLYCSSVLWKVQNILILTTWFEIASYVWGRRGQVKHTQIPYCDTLFWSAEMYVCPIILVLRLTKGHCSAAISVSLIPTPVNSNVFNGPKHKNGNKIIFYEPSLMRLRIDKYEQWYFWSIGYYVLLDLL